MSTHATGEGQFPLSTDGERNEVDNNINPSAPDVAGYLSPDAQIQMQNQLRMHSNSDHKNDDALALEINSPNTSIMIHDREYYLNDMNLNGLNRILTNNFGYSEDYLSKITTISDAKYEIIKNIQIINFYNEKNNNTANMSNEKNTINNDNNKNNKIKLAKKDNYLVLLIGLFFVTFTLCWYLINSVMVAVKFDNSCDNNTCSYSDYESTCFDIRTEYLSYDDVNDYVTLFAFTLIINFIAILFGLIKLISIYKIELKSVCKCLNYKYGDTIIFLCIIVCWIISVGLLINVVILTNDLESTFDDICYGSGCDPGCEAREDIKISFNVVDIFILIIVYVVVTVCVNYLLYVNGVEHCSVCRIRKRSIS